MIKKCPICEGNGALPDRVVHFGDGKQETQICAHCGGKGFSEVEQVKRNKITITKPHGIYRCAEKEV